MLFGRYWLHAATERALTERASSEARLRLLWLYLLWPYDRLTMAMLTIGLDACE